MPAIDILFAGLMIFVPSSSSEPTSMNVYLLDDEHHEASITLYGQVCLANANGRCLPKAISSSGPCSITYEGLEQGAKIECALNKVKTITFDPKIEQEQRYLRRGQLKDRPKNLNQRRSLKWLPRVMNFEIGDSRALAPSKLDAMARTHLEIGWESAQTCAVDGGECNRANIFEFRGGQQPSGEQAVAEEIMFTSRIRSGPSLIHLLYTTADEGNQDVVIRVDCSGQRCVSMLIENTLEYSCKSKLCHSRPAVEPDHFALYYRLVNDPNVMRTPYKIDYELTHEDCDLLLRECSLRLQAPVYPTLVRVLRNNLEAKTVCTQEQIVDYLAGYFLNKRKGQAPSATWRRENFVKFAKALFKPRRVQDRIVCPPVILEP